MSLTYGRGRRRTAPPDIWPGFVDALASLLIVIIFLLMVFTVAQFVLREALSGRDRELDQLNRQ
ncbi:MAG: peptidoglycan-binding protein, partial [Alphaproteobacteria bacterium]